MSDATAFRIDPPAGSTFGLASLFAGVEGLARAVGVVFGGGFVMGMIIVLVIAA
ncbi:MAG: hypothetical protein HY859_16300 [Caulobacterales bacterium]|nr:hypothetical protein [Caulobacterales bacterium]